jgi:hypothetical protein
MLRYVLFVSFKALQDLMAYLAIFLIIYHFFQTIFVLALVVSKIEVVEGTKKRSTK